MSLARNEEGVVSNTSPLILPKVTQNGNIMLSEQHGTYVGQVFGKNCKFPPHLIQSRPAYIS